MNLKAAGDFLIVKKIEEKAATGLIVSSNDIRVQKMTVVNLSSSSQFNLKVSPGDNVCIFGNDIEKLPHITIDYATYYFIKSTDVLAIEKLNSETQQGEVHV